MSEGTDKAGRSVLFSVDGHRLATSMIRDTVAADGRDRGLAWDISIDRLDAPTCVTDGFEASMTTETDEFVGLSARHNIQSRWVISFPSENEARRFVRAWHRRPFPSIQGDEPAIIEAQFIW